MQIRTMIVDDDQQAIDLLAADLKSFPFISLIDTVNSGKSALTILRSKKVDLLFLDIEIGDITGLELAGHIQSVYPHIEIIFVTGHAGFALDGYDYRPLDFLIKPINFFRLEKTMTTVQKSFQEPQKSIIPNHKIGMKVSGGIRIVNVGDILYIEKSGRKISIVTSQDSFVSGDSMKEIETMFDGYGFYRAHQSFIVPLHHIVSVQSDSTARSYTIELTNGQHIPLSRNKYSELQTLLEAEGIQIV
ncbi:MULTISPECIES: LytR/AlgR family response regulator transcription factor [unclassified Sporosarcina]|uniref:LytR/AlgR family response regulator transcription factor n=1 Tax=unclassified Sporosarcina TaxID=2647733 RepID=UPI000579EDE5|nr:LytTR family DNA-binding domain-containing protein [Sporosarcina sp. ZBG7A]